MNNLARTIAAGIVLLVPTYAVAKGTAYDAGLKIAGKRGYSGEQKSCYARVFARHASPSPRGGWSAPVGRSYQGELLGECRITR